MVRDPLLADDAEMPRTPSGQPEHTNDRPEDHRHKRDHGDQRPYAEHDCLRVILKCAVNAGAPRVPCAGAFGQTRRAVDQRQLKRTVDSGDRRL
jgi:hypothetical protein